MRTIRIGMAQINSAVGDIKGNTEKIISYLERGRKLGVDLISFPELAVTGYPPEDLLLMPQFIDANLAALKTITVAASNICAIVGFVDKDTDIYNAAAVIDDGKLIGIYHKIYLPNYGVFDENRYFQAGVDMPVFKFGSSVIGVNICEDMWHPGDPTTSQTLLGDAEIIVNISSSPYHASKAGRRKQMLATRASDNAVIVAFTNLVGGQDELIFDGASMLLDQRGEVLCLGRQFEEDFIVADCDLDAVFHQRLHDPKRRNAKRHLLMSDKRVKTYQIEKPGSGIPVKPEIPARTVSSFTVVEEIYEALKLGIRDYVVKNGFEKVTIGLSGGIDSALVAAIAADSLGNRNVVGVSMPSTYTSKESIEDAEMLSSNLGIRQITIPIDKGFDSFERMLAPAFEGTEPDLTEENLQARIRGTLLMALSNKFGWLVLTTGNKSETSVGYCTLYGDMAGGYGIIKDVPKTLVYELARHINEMGEKEVIPERILTKSPSAELRPNQKDCDSLPPYNVLDPILQAYVEEDKSVKEIVRMGFDEKTVREIIGLVDKNEHKRRQSPPGIKITPKALGKDRRLPISNRFEM